MYGRKIWASDRWRSCLAQNRPCPRATAGHDIFRGFALDHHPMPHLQIEQPPDSVTVVARLRAMLAEQSLDRVRPEKSAFEAARLKHHTLQIFQLRAGQPVFPWRGEAHLLPVNNLSWEQIFDSPLEYKLARH